MDLDEIKRITGVSDRTIRNWKKNGFPPVVDYLLTWTNGTHPKWNGIRFGDGVLYLPCNTPVFAGELEMLPWLKNELRTTSRAYTVLEQKYEAMCGLQKSANAESHSLDDIVKLVI